MATSVQREYRTILLSSDEGTDETVEMVDGTKTDEYNSTISYSLSSAIAPATLTNWDRVNVRVVRYGAPMDPMPVQPGKNIVCIALHHLSIVTVWFCSLDPILDTPANFFAQDLGQQIANQSISGAFTTPGTTFALATGADYKLRISSGAIQTGYEMIILPDGPHGTTWNGADLSDYRSSLTYQLGMDYNTPIEADNSSGTVGFPYPVTNYSYSAVGVRSDLVTSSPSGNVHGDAEETGIIAMMPFNQKLTGIGNFTATAAIQQDYTSFEAGSESFVPVDPTHDLQNFTIEMIDDHGGPYFYNNGGWFLELQFEFEKDYSTLAVTDSAGGGGSSGSGKYKRLDDYIFRT